MKMTTKTNALNLLVLALLTSGMATKAVSAKEISIELDKGNLNLLFDKKIADDVKYDIKIPNHCSGTKLDVKRDKDNVIFSHQGAACSEGATVNLKVRDAAKVKALVKAGLLNFKGASTTMPNVSELSALVEAGNIESQVATIKPVRTSNYSGMRANYSNDKGQMELKLEVSAGMIAIEK